MVITGGKETLETSRIGTGRGRTEISSTVGSTVTVEKGGGLPIKKGNNFQKK